MSLPIPVNAFECRFFEINFKFHVSTILNSKPKITDTR